MNFDNLHQILRNLYDQMMPMCGDMIGIAKGIAGLGALFYVAYRVWQSLARAEPIDVFPLLRPLAIGLCIMFFPTIVLGTINNVMSPIVQGTHKMMENQTLSMREYAEQRDRVEYEAKLRNPETAYLVSDAAFDQKLSTMGVTNVVGKVGLYAEWALYEFKKWVQQLIMNILELIFQAAGLAIDVVRTFSLIILSILGPVAFAFAVWDGFQSTLTAWLMRYISIYLWLPVSDLYGAILARIQEQVIKNDIAGLQADPGYIMDSTDAVYIIIMIIGIIGYFSVPTIAGWIIQAGGGGALTKGVNAMGMKGGAFAAGMAGAAAGNMAGQAGRGIAAGGRYIGGKLKSGAKSIASGIRGRRSGTSGNGSS
ncbi:conjugative transposon protein TraJ [Dysgonomonas sp. GY75]|uniref:conjugative transposon protein TraJ n=1 Tax=Dysgonomonas sp. GY75 TaxID=2780419 RepID=UPI001883BAC8|nr:conjugative transposon protein TraJ [Dysgonomonas sp. GY75]MBF0647432.1 conjugative transposon protein TraJ [Dysgonomonas sp. GY75]